MYITGGVGSRYDGESFGETYELPTDQCYCETCAAIGNFFWNWRMLLVTGESRFADLMERLMYNVEWNQLLLCKSIDDPQRQVCAALYES
jgi:DUF1680 family protein